MGFGMRLVAAYYCEDCRAKWVAPQESPTMTPPAPWRKVWRGFGGFRWSCQPKRHR